MVEFAIRPDHCIVAAFAGQREGKRHVVDRRLGVVVIGLMACCTSRARQVVVIVHVALSARRGRMCSRQSKAGRRMVERRVQPVRRIVAPFASRRIAQRDMIHRRLRVVVIRLVARHARRTGQLIVVVDVAQCARGGSVETCERPTGTGVVELAVRPQHSVVAALASCREAERNVIHGRLRGVVIRLVARYAGRAGQLIVVVDVAQSARRGGMRSR